MRGSSNTSKRRYVGSALDNRRERIADAALDILAEHGARGLTHRAVDRALALADGSTSFYFRTRSALLLASAERLLALDLVDIAAMPRDRTGIVSLVALWTSPPRRLRSLARLELLLSAARNPELHFMQQTRAQFIDRVAGTAQGKSASSAVRVTGIALVSLVDGLTLQGLVSGKLTRAELTQILQKVQPAR